jgi:hypothetical protein
VTTLAAHPGDEIALVTRLIGRAAAPQHVTIDVDNGPGRSLTVAASVPGGQISKATITSPSHTPIALADFRYACFVPPAPTFCPARRISTSAHSDTLSFSASPASPAIVTLVTVAAG